MFGTEIIEVGIGLAFAYFAISIICSGIVEAGVNLTKLRARHMKAALGILLDDKHFTGFVKELYEHHLIASPMKDQLGDPTSISSKNFALAVLDLLGAKGNLSDAEQFKLIKAKIETMKDDKMKTKMLAMLNSSAYQVDTMRDKIEAWFNESMVSVSEWYRNRMRRWVMLVSLIVVGVMNADTIKMATMLWNDDELRTATVSAAEGYIKRYDDSVSAGSAQGLVPVETTVKGANGQDSIIFVAAPIITKDTNVVNALKHNLTTIYQDINDLKVLPIGWSSERLPCKPGYTDPKSPLTWWILKIVGLILTVGAVSLGSTYWYSQLKSLLNLRAGGKKDAETAAAMAPTNINLTMAPPVTAAQASAAAESSPVPTKEVNITTTEVVPDAQNPEQPVDENPDSPSDSNPDAPIEPADGDGGAGS